MLADEAERRKRPSKTVYVGAATGESPYSAVGLQRNSELRDSKLEKGWSGGWDITNLN